MSGYPSGALRLAHMQKTSSNICFLISLPAEASLLEHLDLALVGTSFLHGRTKAHGAHGQGPGAHRVLKCPGPGPKGYGAQVSCISYAHVSQVPLSALGQGLRAMGLSKYI